MKTPSIPADEEARLAALVELDILDTPVEDVFEGCLKMAADLCGVSSGGVSLMDRERQWFKAVFGRLPKETSRDVSFCGHAIAQDDMLVVNDTALDARFADNPLVTADGGIRFYAGMPLHGRDGQPLGTLCVIHDVPHALTKAQLDGLRTIADHLEEILLLRHLALRTAARADETKRANEALMKLDEQRRDTVAMLVHDLKNPLTVVSVIARFAESHDLPPEVAEALRELIASADVANRMVCDILDVSSSETGALRASFKPFDVQDLVTRLLRRLQCLAAEREQTTALTSDLADPTVRGDSMLVSRALRNLLDNAFKYAPAGGEVRVVLRDVDGAIEVRVEDDGPVVPEASRKAIFEPHVRGENDCARPSHGLGLAFCAAVARSHGGTMRVEALPSGGNAFCLRLPG